MEMNLRDKVALVTGASSGIGLATVKALLREGVRVAAFYRDEAKGLQSLQTSLNDGELWTSSQDVSQPLCGPVMVNSTVERFGRVDILVNNAGLLIEKPFAITEEEEWESLFAVNLRAVASLCRAVMGPMFLQRSGAIVNISSLAASHLGRGVAAYASLKAGVDRLTQILAQETARKGVRVNAIAPGVIRSAMSESLMQRSSQPLLDRIPMRRVGLPEEVAAAVLFLASETMASYITGHVLTIDGGIGL